ncbi:uncharacterized protein F5Z01DRAFT_548998 [Emericellopsis atlantica]|uniref:Uncharacterized protein n=1 Tax=Emericellopsis atlantica TaxID=2614577 RepID=A0A9P7ZQ27_9HYPO|nr:uncharacterized protein F5Z01DRAFT_548998 [Emericellopsis atlantica]KAG9255588.1 hypothetical protein F5Z01DRAFT_548998 [Emericellopsis atlantica]
MLFYPVSAALNIFCNILLDPLSPSVAGDLTLISSASELIKKLIERSPGGRNATWLPCLNTFIVELVHLGQSSVNRAKNGSAQV